ncbi:MAG: CoA transferase [candidate division NC10 bacterium]|nr:CoA transferase [candidate division NC10 bacterium]
MKPLDGIRVVDLSRILAGPYCSMILADLGAEVVKVEEMPNGDEARQVGPFVEGVSAYFMSLNRGKKSITLNLKDPQGRALLIELAKRSDILLENFRPGTMQKLGLSYDTLAQVNPRLIYGSLSGFGQTGPYASRRAFDIIVQGMGGIMSITGEPGRPPVRVGAAIGDMGAGLFTAIGILAALQARERTGVGQQVDVGMLDCQVALLEYAIIRYTTSGEVPGPLGTRHPWITPFEVFEAKDGPIVLGVGTKHWTRFCGKLGLPGLAENPRFATNALRTTHYEELRPTLAEIMKTKGVEEWIREMEEIGVPCGPINTVDRVVSNPQVQAREMITEVEHEGVGKVKMAACPVKLSETPSGIQGPAPTLGQHTEEVLTQLLGCSTEQVKTLRQDGIV